MKVFSRNKYAPNTLERKTSTEININYYFAIALITFIAYSIASLALTLGYDITAGVPYVLEQAFNPQTTRPPVYLVLFSAVAFLGPVAIVGLVIADLYRGVYKRILFARLKNSNKTPSEKKKMISLFKKRMQIENILASVFSAIPHVAKAALRLSVIFALINLAMIVVFIAQLPIQELLSNSNISHQIIIEMHQLYDNHGALHVLMLLAFVIYSVAYLHDHWLRFMDTRTGFNNTQNKTPATEV